MFKYEIIDLSHQIDENMTVYMDSEKPKLEEVHTMKEHGFRERKLTFFSHIGTHVDAPAHMIEEGNFLDDYEIDKFIGSAFIADFKNFKLEYIDIEDLTVYEDKLKISDFFIINTGFYKDFYNDKYYLEFPTLTKEAANYLLKFNLKGIGIDTLSIDKLSSKDYYLHNIFLKNEILIIENLNNLDSLKNEMFTLNISPLKLKKADGSPIRAIGIKNL
ncbi:MAG: cyclase family protein [Peptostreptococcaceae bacterium]|jgi:kynurenine formamidase|nr:cyclase family protein [Peptostreptococcaceae bacterium]